MMGMATATEHASKGRAGPTRFWVAVKNRSSKWVFVWAKEAHLTFIDRGMYRATYAAGEVEVDHLPRARVMLNRIDGTWIKTKISNLIITLKIIYFLITKFNLIF